MDNPVIGIPAKIIIETQYVFDGKVLDITPSHHIIQRNNGKILEIKSDRVVSVEGRQMETVRSNIKQM